MNDRDFRIASAVWEAAAVMPKMPETEPARKPTHEPKLMKLKGYSVPRCWRPFEELFR